MPEINPWKYYAIQTIFPSIYADNESKVHYLTTRRIEGNDEVDSWFINDCYDFFDTSLEARRDYRTFDKFRSDCYIRILEVSREEYEIMAEKASY